ncbi:GerMN domain-containing protein [Streptomyces sp. NPDC057686]|uniref:GerMN domain-containing protein n=1 Tax=Streptomyces sp. NPDC057686 TaxID=3346212 RepID=UPI0036BA5D4A
MVIRRRSWALTCVGLIIGQVMSATTCAEAASVSSAAPQEARRAAPAVPVLVAVRAAHHPGYDRLVFEFRGPVPVRRSVRYVPQVISDGSGLPVQVAGKALLQVTFEPAQGHDDRGQGTFGPVRRAYALPGIIQMVSAGDFEGVLSFGVGLARREPLIVSTLTSPSRVVIDIRTPFQTAAVKDYFLDGNRFATGHEPYVRPVTRPAIPPALADGALRRLFAGPTQSELASGLQFPNSGATGFKDLSIRSGVARVTLTGGCSSSGSTFTIADEIIPTLKQFSSVKWVKIYDPAGHTQRPAGNSDSIPQCLEP